MLRQAPGNMRLGCVLLVGMTASACCMLVVGPRGVQRGAFPCLLPCPARSGSLLCSWHWGLWECVEESALGLRTFQGWQCGTATPAGKTGSWPGFPIVCLSTPHSRTLGVEHCEWPAGFWHLL